MTLKRYSAVEMFGVPVDGWAKSDDPEEMIAVMSNYGIEGQDIPREGTDITPYYWRKPAFRYYLSLAHPEGPAIVELLPHYADSSLYLMEKIGGYAVDLEIPGLRHLEIPTDQNALAIVGPSPRFKEQFCIHELVAYTG